MENFLRALPTRAAVLMIGLVCGLLFTPFAGAQTDLVVVERGSSMLYLANSTDPGLALTWTQNGFDDSSWTPGTYGIGYETGLPGAIGLIDTTVPNTTVSIYTRISFNVADVGQITNLFLGADFDDAYAAWINGVEVFRSSGLPGGALDWNTPGGDHESSDDSAPHYEFTDITTAALTLLVNGSNELSIGAFNAGAGSSDLVLVPNLTLNKTTQLTRGPYLQQGTHDSITVRWRTDVPTDSEVLCGPAPGSLVLCGLSAVAVSEHVIELTGLTADTPYYYSVGSSSEILAGADVDHLFTTAPIPGVARPTRVWVLGDSGKGDQNAIDVRDAYYNFAGTDPTHLWLMLGDNAYDSGTDGEHQTKLFDVFPEMLQRSVLWPTLGNHDSATANSISQTGPYFDIFTLPSGGEAGGVSSGTEAYYSFDYGNIHFVVLDSTNSPRAPTSPMLVWLANDLAATAQDWIIAFWHHPPYSKGSHDSDMEAAQIEMRENVVPILDDYGVDLTFTGHSHDYERSFLIDGHYDLSATFNESMKVATGDGNPGGDGPYVKPVLGPDPHSGIVHTVAGNGSQVSGGGLDHPAMVLSLNLLGSVVLDVNANQLDVRMLDSTGTIQDRFTVIKGSIAGLPVASFSASPLVGAAPLSVQFIDTTQNSPTAWQWDFDNDTTLDSSAQNPSHGYTQPGVYDVRLTVVNALGSDETLQAGAICVHTPAPTQVTGLRFTFFSDRFGWDAAPGVTGYDAVQGNLSLLRANSGDFELADVTCLGNDLATSLVMAPSVPGPGEAFFYLARTADCSNRTGSFDAVGSGQAAPRDLALQGPAAACACDSGDDPDADGYCSAFDSCTDSDGDGFGDPGFPNSCPTDNCPFSPNPGQADDDLDGAGNVCDICPQDAADDSDLDGACDSVDNCPMIANPAQADADLDNVGDVCDNCPATSNLTQSDGDADGLGDACDACPADPLKIEPGDCGCGFVDLDLDSDGVTDCVDVCIDVDGDGYGIDGGGGVCLGSDCDDGSPAINPGSAEIGCDGVDNDCNAGTQDVLDADSDSYACDVDCHDGNPAINPGMPETGCDGVDNDCNVGTPDVRDDDSDTYSCDVDCNDGNPAINPGATEVGCDGVDNDCSAGTSDILDADNDTYACDVDCNDSLAFINPGATEVGCDGIDNDCNAGTSDILDGDSDTYACDVDCNDQVPFINPGEVEIGCDGLNNDCDFGTPDLSDTDNDLYTCDLDCNDNDASINPGATEIGCDALDNDCDAGTPDVLDADTDTFTCDVDCNDADPNVNPGQTEVGCDGIDNDCNAGTLDILDADTDTYSCDVDCDDGNAAVNPGAAEIGCDGIDNDCTLATPDLDDADVDGFTCAFDCNDADPNVNPGQAEIGCDGIDNDCNAGTLDIDDIDMDTYACDVDCNDADPNINPGQAEISCDGIDNDCNAGTLDIDDIDMDTYACDVDCNDTDPNVNPGQAEIGCDGIDNDCNAGTIDILDADVDTYACDVDCNDADPNINPGQTEITCDGIDNDCNVGTVDLVDVDMDTYVCDVDCNDADANINPGQTEIGCDGIDNDCNVGTVDLVDVDMDTYTCDVDCNDADPNINPGQAEIGCDGIDNDCNAGTPDIFDIDGDGFTCDLDCDETSAVASSTFPGAAPNDDPFACMTDVDGDDWGRFNVGPGVTSGTDCNDMNAVQNPTTVWYRDTDADGFGNPNASIVSCAQPAGYVLDNQDCDDTSPTAASTFPGAAPNDSAMACMKDVDGDDFGDEFPPAGVTPGTDCDDTNIAMPPGC